MQKDTKKLKIECPPPLQRLASAWRRQKTGCQRLVSASPAPGGARRQDASASPAPGGARKQTVSAWSALLQRLEAPEHVTAAINQKLVIFRISSCNVLRLLLWRLIGGVFHSFQTSYFQV